MNEAEVKTTIGGLLAKIAALETENARLSDQATACTSTVARLIDEVESLRRTARANKYRKRPPVMRGRTVQVNVGCGPLYITLNEDDEGRPFEAFFKLGKSGSCQQSYLEALGVAISVGLRYGADPMKFVEKFEGMRCPRPLSKLQTQGGPAPLSCADGISQGLAKALALALPGTEPPNRAEAKVISVAEPQVPAGNEPLIDLIAPIDTSFNFEPQLFGTTEAKGTITTGSGMCPKCGGPLATQGGCETCLLQCGYEKCG